MMRGQREVTCWADMRTRMTLKQRNTEAWTMGEEGMVRRLSARRSDEKRNKLCSNKTTGVASR